MKTFSLIVLAMLLATACSHAEADPSAQPPPAIPAEPVPSTSAPAPAAPAQTAIPTQTGSKARHEPAKALDQKGKIEKVDAAAGTFVVAGKTFTVSKKPRIEVDGTMKSLADLKEGDLVAVVYFAKPDGLNEATRVIKGNAARHKKAKAAKAEPADAPSAPAN